MTAKPDPEVRKILEKFALRILKDYVDNNPVFDLKQAESALDKAYGRKMLELVKDRQPDEFEGASDRNVRIAINIYNEGLRALIRDKFNVEEES